MDVGLIIPSACIHGMQTESYLHARTYSRSTTPVIVLADHEVAVPGGVKVKQRPDVRGEAELWNWGLDYACGHGWEWCVFLHDDFAMDEPGWELQLEAAKEFRVAAASWCVMDRWDVATPTKMSPVPFGVAFDSMTFAFHVPTFKQRGYVCEASGRNWDCADGWGYDSMNANGWLLEQGYAMWRIMLNARHQWSMPNARGVLGRGAPGYGEVTARFGHLLPAERISEVEIDCAGRRHVIAEPGALKRLPFDYRRRVVLMNCGTEMVTEGGATL